MPLPVLCCVCQVTLIDEIQSKCGHFFCRKCLEKCFNMVGGDTLKCPECLSPILRSVLQDTAESLDQQRTQIEAEDDSKPVYGRQTELHDASFKGDLDKVKELVSNGADMYERSDKKNVGYAPIHDASYMGHINVVKYFMSKDRSLAKSRSVQEGMMPIHTAALNGKKSIVSYFVEDIGIDTEVRVTLNGRTSLHVAANKGHVNVVRYLVSCGADVRAKCNATDYEDMPIHIAAYFGSLNVVKYFIEDVDSSLGNAANPTGQIPFHKACLNGQLETAKYFVNKRNVDINHRWEQTSRTPLLLACGSRNVELVKFLLEKGADNNAVDNDGWTMLHMAAFFGQLEVVKYIVSRYPHLKDTLSAEDESALDIAGKSTREGAAAVVEFLE